MAPRPVPGYWMYETTGVLAPVVKKFLECEELTAGEIATMRAYVRQWMAGDFRGPEAEQLRSAVDAIDSTAKLHAWFNAAWDAGIDPL